MSFRERYEIQKPAVYESKTTKVYKAIDRGLARHLYDSLAKSRQGFDKFAFQKATKTIELASRVNGVYKEGDFDQIKDEDGNVPWQAFEKYAEKTFGKFDVAIKVMTTEFAYNQEVQVRQELRVPNVVVPLLPSPDLDIYQSELNQLRDIDKEIKKYPYFIVMPFAECTWAELAKTCKYQEQTNDLMELAAILKTFHDRFVHCNLTKHNVVILKGQPMLIDMYCAVQTRADDVYLGLKVDPSTIPPEMITSLYEDDELEQYNLYWQDVKETNPALWEVLEPREGCVMKAFDPSKGGDGLPYSLREADPSADVWAYGCLLFETMCGRPFVSVDEITEIANWDDGDVDDRVDEHVAPGLLNDLLKNVLSFDPDDRLSMDVVLQRLSNKPSVESLRQTLEQVSKRLNEKSRQISEVIEEVEDNSNIVMDVFDNLIRVIDNLKRNILMTILNSNDFDVPSKLIVLPFKLELWNKRPEDAQRAELFLHFMFSPVWKALEDFGDTKRLVKNLHDLNGDRPLYLYLVDEVTGLPVLPQMNDAQDGKDVYPIKFMRETEEYMIFMTTCLPLIGYGFQVIKNANGIDGLLRWFGVANLDKENVENVSVIIDGMYNTPDAFVKSLGSKENHETLIRKVRVAQLNHLRRILSAYAIKHNVGLERGFFMDGRPFWSTPINVKRINAGESVLGIRRNPDITNRVDQKKNNQTPRVQSPPLQEAAAVQSRNIDRIIAEESVKDIRKNPDITNRVDPKQNNQTSKVQSPALQDNAVVQRREVPVKLRSSNEDKPNSICTMS